MMSILLITYAKKTVLKDYTPLYESIKANSVSWWHYLDDVWIVNSIISADEFAKKLYPYITKDDRLLVVKLTAEHQGWLPPDAWKWLNEQSYF
jgi:hypothetical protein